jgi:hypothetical protein
MIGTPSQKQLDARAAGALRLMNWRLSKRVMAPMSPIMAPMSPIMAPMGGKLMSSLKALKSSGSVGDVYRTKMFTYKKIAPGKVVKM